VDQEVGAAGSTGRGEENIRVAGAHTIVEMMRQGMEPREACLEALKRIAKNYRNNMDLLNRFDINFYALRKDGLYGAASLWNGRMRRGYWADTQFAVNDGTGPSRLEKCAFLFERKRS
jgi:N4-(beta-N-acetylglucosaminyl)-L-asparaginase